MPYPVHLSMGLFGGLRGWGSLGFAHNCVFKRVLIKVMQRFKVCSSLSLASQAS